MTHSLVVQNGAALPAHIQNRMTQDGAPQSNFLKGVGGARDQITFKGSRFTFKRGGVEIPHNELFLDVILLDAMPNVGRLYYGAAYVPGQATAPKCWSNDGDTPAFDATERQADVCQSCPMNQKGSAVGQDGQSRKACGYVRRLVVAVRGDEEMRPLQMDMKSMSIFGDSRPDQNLYSLNDFIKVLQSGRIDPGFIVMRLSFDVASSVPKVFFSAVDYLTEQELMQRDEVLAGIEVAEWLKLSVASSSEDSDPTAINGGVGGSVVGQPLPPHLGGPAAGQAADGTVTPAAPAPAAQPQVAAAAPAAPTQPAPTPAQGTAPQAPAAPAPAPAVQPAAQPAAAAPAPVQPAAPAATVAAESAPVAASPTPAPVSPAEAAPVSQSPAAQAPAAVTAAAAPPVSTQPAAQQAAEVPVIEGDDELAALLGDLSAG